MTPELGELLVAYLDGPEASCAPTPLGRHMERHPEDVPEILEFIRDAAGLQLILDPSLDSLPERVRDTLEFGKSGNAFCDRVIHELGRGKSNTDQGAAGPSPSRRPARRPFRILALAASLAVVVGGAIMALRIPETPRLQVVDVSGKVTLRRDGSDMPVSVGMELKSGDRLAAANGQRATLRYSGEDTSIDLHSATASFRTDKSAKRVHLTSGLLLCAAAPQKRPFLLETPHAVAEVMGTRFWLDVTPAQTTLAVQEGTVALQTRDERLDVASSQTVVANRSGLKRLSPADAWIAKLLARAEAGPWDAVDFSKGLRTRIEAKPFGEWYVDVREESSEGRIWQTDSHADSQVLVDATSARMWKRGVFVGYVTLLPEKDLPASLAVSKEAVTISRKTGRAVTADNVPNGAYGVLYYGTGRRGGQSYLRLSLAVVGEHAYGVQYAFAMYVDADKERNDGALGTSMTWPEGETVPPATKWTKLPARRSAVGRPFGIGLRVKHARVLWENVKFVPLGAEFPHPPSWDAMSGKGH